MLVLFSINVALIGARDEVVRYLPQTASLFAAIGLPVNLRHLKFENVHNAKETQDGVNILIVEAPSSATANGRSRCRACALPRATPPARNSTPGPRCRAAAFLDRAKRSISTAGWLRRRPAPST